jgi:hypothetical protein
MLKEILHAREMFRLERAFLVVSYGKRSALKKR